jgi:hypothetical protein
MVWVLAGWYLRKANRDFDPLEERVRALAEEGVLPGTGEGAGSRPATEGRFVREDVPGDTAREVRP